MSRASLGVTETEDGKPTVASREYCPILDTQTGCVARDYTGAVCGATWDARESVWHSQIDSGKQDSESMAALEKPTARVNSLHPRRQNATGSVVAATGHHSLKCVGATGLSCRHDHMRLNFAGNGACAMALGNCLRCSVDSELKQASVARLDLVAQRRS